MDNFRVIIVFYLLNRYLQSGYADLVVGSNLNFTSAQTLARFGLIESFSPGDFR